jgi:hypothetical protein
MRKVLYLRLPRENTIEGLSRAYLKSALDLYCDSVTSPYAHS